MVLVEFQSTLPRRERHAHGCDACCAVIISIHAPAKGATRSIVPCLTKAYPFQSTLPRRERRTCLQRPGRVSLHFNPRSREGSDARKRRECKKICGISIHAPAKGATLTTDLLSGWMIFQSTLPRRERLGGCLPCQHSCGISIHAPAKGAT